MPSLNWIGKEKIVNHDKDVPFRLLRKNKKYSLGKSENLILEGDNLEALKALMPFYYGKIKCIYIDPPYNTGNEKWVYNDRVNSPKIKEWLGKVVGPEGDDLTRHDKWLCMMYPRLKLLRELLSDDGVIFISIDDNEHCNLKMAMDEIFGNNNFIAGIVAQINPRGRTLDKFLAKTYEYILLYAKDATKNTAINLIEKEGELLNTYHKQDDRGIYRELELRNRNPVFNRSNRPNLFYPLYVNPKTSAVALAKGRNHSIQVLPKDSRNVDGCWTWGKEKVFNHLDELVGRRVSTGAWRIYRKDYLHNEKGEIAVTKAKALWLDKDINNENGKEICNRIFKKCPFDFPKSVELIKKCIKLGSNSNDIILDSFVGSGTTAHAVLDLNKEDGGNRKFILVEMEKNIAKKITAERVKRVAKGYSYKTGKGKQVKVTGLGGGFEYVELGEPLFDKDGMISKEMKYQDLASYIYFTETHTNLEKNKIKGNYLGNSGDTHYFLLFDGIGKNVLDRKFLKELKAVAGRKIIYADKCLLDEEILEKNQIIFKQIPYQIKIY